MGVDEKSFAKGHKYETIVYDIDKGTVEEVIDNREQKSLEAYYKQFTPAELDKIETIAMDMWDPYIAATKACVPGADEKIVFDHYHITRIMSKAVDKVRKNENEALLKNGFDLLTGTKYLWLWNEENVPEFRREEFNSLRALDLKVCRAYAIKENLRNMWNYKTAGWMRRFFKAWYFWATHSRLKPVIDAAKTIDAHIDNIVTYAKHKVTNALAESLNSKIEKVKRMACGYRNRAHYKIAIFFHCGGLDLYPVRSLSLCQVLT
jgi:transposase